MLRHLAAAIASVAVAVTLLWPVAVQAHEGANAFVHVPLDHIVVDQAFPVIVSGFLPGVVVSLALTVDGASRELGTVTVDEEGSAQASLRLPAGVKSGYLQLAASDDDGTTATTWVRVGAEPLPQDAESGQWHLDGSVLLPAAILLAALIVVVVFAARLRRRV